MRDLTNRLNALEANSDIQFTKGRYWRAIDAGTPDEAARCLTRDVKIDFEGMGVFDDRESFIGAIRSQANIPGQFHMHHGLNPRVEVQSATTARGTWQIRYQGIFTNINTLVNMSGFYEDTYMKIDGEWLIASMRMRQHTMTSTVIDQNGAATISGLPQPKTNSNQECD